MVSPVESTCRTEIRCFTLWTPPKIDLCNLQFKRWGKPEIVAAIASHLKYDALLWMINDGESLTTSVCGAALAFVSLPQAWALDTVVFDKAWNSQVAFLQSDAIKIYEKKIISWSLFCSACRQKTPHPIFNRERLSGRLFALLLEWKTLQLDWE